MNLSLCKIKPSKGLGQNFLVDKAAVKKVIDAADLKPSDIVLEIGPGTGILTKELAKQAKKVIAVEKDPKMVDILRENLKNSKNVEIIQADILKISNSQYLISNKMPNVKYQNSGIGHSRIKQFIGNWKLEGEEINLFFPFVCLTANSVIGNSYKVVANLPFYLTAPVIRQLLERTDARRLYAVFVVQKEVGQRICASPPNMSILAVSVQFYAQAKIISYISKKSFWPQPKVDAALIKIIPLKIKSHDRRISSQRRNLFFKIVKAGFCQPRKQLINNLSKGLKLNRVKVEGWLKENNIQPTQRAETLNVKDWINLTKTFKIN